MEQVWNNLSSSRAWLPGRRSGTTRTQRELAVWLNLTGLGKRSDQEPDGHSGQGPEILSDDGRNFQKDNHHCNAPPSALYGSVTGQKPPLSKRHMEAWLEFAKEHVKGTQTVRNCRFHLSDETKMQLFGLNSKWFIYMEETRHRSSPSQYQANSEAWWWVGLGDTAKMSQLNVEDFISVSQDRFPVGSVKKIFL